MEGHESNQAKNTHNLELHGLALKLDGPNLEVHTNCANVALSVGVIRETEEQARLPWSNKDGKQRMGEPTAEENRPFQHQSHR